MKTMSAASTISPMHSFQDNPSPDCGTLYIVATPVGNLEDITFRAVRILQEVFLIAAEDTRHSQKLLSHYNIATDTISCHEHNEQFRAEKLIPILQQGKDVALITDAGTPCISDPGFRLVTAVLEQNIRVVPIPGCCAVIAGLSAAGLPTDRFLFAGFLPKKQQQQVQAIKKLASRQATLVFYESPKRIRPLLDQLMAGLGDRQACLAREVTKIHETFIRGLLSHIAARLDAAGRTRGECTLFVAGAAEKEKLSRAELESVILDGMAQGAVPTAGLAKEISMRYSISRKMVYDTILQIKSR